METVLLILVIGLINALCFFLGAKVGQKVINQEPIELPKINPIEAHREYQENKEVRKQQERYQTMLDNINNYNGTSLGQKDIPM